MPGRLFEVRALEPINAENRSLGTTLRERMTGFELATPTLSDRRSSHLRPLRGKLVDGRVVHKHCLDQSCCVDVAWPL